MHREFSRGHLFAGYKYYGIDRLLDKTHRLSYHQYYVNKTKNIVRLPKMNDDPTSDDLPKHNYSDILVFDTDDSITWHFTDGFSREVTSFKYLAKNNIGDQFMNVNNDIITKILHVTTTLN